MTNAVNQINSKIQALETADEGFKTQITDLTNQYTDLAKNKADKTALEKVETDLTAAINGEITRARDAEAALKAAIKKIEEETIPAIQLQINDLQTLVNKKLDKSEFETYKTETAETIRLINEAIDEIKANYVTKEEYKEKVAEIIAKFDDVI